MKELKEQFPSYKDFLALTERQVAEVLRSIIAARANDKNPISCKTLSVGELENIYDSHTLPYAGQQQVNDRLLEAYQWLLSENYIRPASGQAQGVVTVTTKGQQPLSPEPPSVPAQSEDHLTRRTAAIFVADVVGYSRLVGLDEEGTLAQLRTIEAEVFNPAIAECHGRLFKTTGDGLLVEFGSVVDALRCALAVQATIALRAAAVAPENKILFRIGIHYGDVVVEGDDLRGDDVNIAARLEGKAEPGGVCVSALVRELVASKLDVSFEELTESDLKNILRSMKIYSVHAGRGTRDAPAPSKGLIALGPDIVCEGEIIAVTPSEWTLRLGRRFVIGDDINALIAFSEGFDRAPSHDRYLVVNTLGDGRKLAGAPTFDSTQTGYVIKCPVLPKFPQIEAQTLGSTCALSESNDLMAHGGSIATISGFESLPQHLKTSLSFQRGESPIFQDAGARLAEYYHAYRTSPWLEALLKLEVIRQAAVPYYNTVQNREYTPLQCVERVWDIELLAEAPENRWLPIRFDLDVAGVGRRQFDIPILIPEQSELMLIARRAAETSRMNAQYVQPQPAQVALKRPT